MFPFPYNAHKQAFQSSWRLVPPKALAATLSLSLFLLLRNKNLSGWPRAGDGPHVLKNSHRLFFSIINMRQNFNAVGIFIIGVLAILVDCQSSGQLKYKAVALVPDDDPHCNFHEMRIAGQHCITGFPFGKSRPSDVAAVCQNVPGDILWTCSGDHTHRKGLGIHFLENQCGSQHQNGAAAPNRSSGQLII